MVDEIRNEMLAKTAAKTIVDKFVEIGVEVLEIMLDNVAIEIYDKTFIKMSVGYTCLTERERKRERERERERKRARAY